jgi:hypothetical protein
MGLIFCNFVSYAVADLQLCPQLQCLAPFLGLYLLEPVAEMTFWFPGLAAGRPTPDFTKRIQFFLVGLRFCRKEYA